MTSQALNRPVDVLSGERDARTIYDIACIREERHGASREDVEFKAIALRNYRFCAAVAELIEAAKEFEREFLYLAGRTDFPLQDRNRWSALAAMALAALAAVEGQS